MPSTSWKNTEGLFTENNFQEVNDTPNEVKNTIEQILLLASESTCPQVLVDISCLSRSAIARWVHELANVPLKQPTTIDFIYSHAEFIPPPGDEIQLKSHQSVIPEFYGLFRNISAPSFLLIGLGYEKDASLAFLERLEPEVTCSLIPANHDGHYEKALRSTNALFLNSTDRSLHITYDVFDPYSTFQKVESVIAGTCSNYSVSLAAMGPKKFALSSYVAAILHYPNILVWDLNFKCHNEYRRNRKATGKVSLLRIVSNSIP